MRVLRGPAPLLLLVALALAGCERKKPARTAAGDAPGGPPSAQLVLGHVAPLSGPEAALGDAADKGIRLAVDEQNAAGGVKGRTLVVRSYDDQGRPEEAALAASRLVAEDRAVVLLGEVASRRSLAMAAIADKHQVPMVTPSATDPRVTREGDRVRPFVFRACAVETLQGTVMARFAREALKLERVALLRDAGDDASVGLADHFLARFRALGGEVVDDLSYRSGSADLRPQLAALKRRRPQAIYLPGAPADAALAARQAREVGLDAPLLGGDRWDPARLPEGVRLALEGSYFTSAWSPDDPAGASLEFVRRFRERHGVAPDAAAAQGYDAARLAMAALSRATDLSGPAVRDALAATRDLPGATGPVSVDAGHDGVRPAAVLKVERGAPRFVAALAP